MTLAVNLLFIASPVSVGYAIVKHRVLGFRVFVRLGIQYVLAQNVLRAAVALPAALIVYAVASNPNRTVGEIFAGSARLQVVVIVLAGAALRFRAPLAAAIDRRFFRTAYDQEIILLRLIESIKQLDSLSEISAMVSREIDAALHVTRIMVLYGSPADRSLTVGFCVRRCRSRGDSGHQRAGRRYRTVADRPVARRCRLAIHAGRSGLAGSPAD